MYKILIDTTKRFNKSVKLLDSKTNDLIEEISGDIDTASTIEKLLKKHHIKTNEVEEIIPNTGPGSFTGIKIGITIANVFNWAKGKKDIKNIYTPEYGQEPNIQPQKKT